MEELIKEAFLHVEIIGPHAIDGHYDLHGPDGEIILPQVWESVIEPGWSITMHMWPMPEAPPPEPTPLPSPPPPPAPKPAPAAPPPPPALEQVPDPEPALVPAPRPQPSIPPLLMWTAGRYSKGSRRR